MLDGIGGVVYNGDQGVMMLQVDLICQMDISVLGQVVFQGNGQDIFKIMINFINVLLVLVIEVVNKVDDMVVNNYVYFVGSGQILIVVYKVVQVILDVMKLDDLGYQVQFILIVVFKLQLDVVNVVCILVVGSQVVLVCNLVQFNIQIDLIFSSVFIVKVFIGVCQNELDNFDVVGEVNKENYIQIINNLLGCNLFDISELISDLMFKQIYLLVVQKVFVIISGLILLNYLK